jgi:hypothetical protein
MGARLQFFHCDFEMFYQPLLRPDENNFILVSVHKHAEDVNSPKNRQHFGTLFSVTEDSSFQ